MLIRHKVLSKVKNKTDMESKVITFNWFVSCFLCSDVMKSSLRSLYMIEDRCISVLFNVDRRVIYLDWIRAKFLPDMMTDIMGKEVSHEFTHTRIPLLSGLYVCCSIANVCQIVLSCLQDKEASSTVIKIPTQCHRLLASRNLMARQ